MIYRKCISDLRDFIAWPEDLSTLNSQDPRYRTRQATERTRNTPPLGKPTSPDPDPAARSELDQVALDLDLLPGGRVKTSTLPHNPTSRQDSHPSHQDLFEVTWKSRSRPPTGTQGEHTQHKITDHRSTPSVSRCLGASGIRIWP